MLPQRFAGHAGDEDMTGDWRGEEESGMNVQVCVACILSN
jgi:hypothetical protein